jgi:shikimate kinase
MHIILIGSRGTGKTTLGKLLAEKTKMPFVDLDEENAKALELLIKEEISWVEFREIEEQILAQVLEREDCVISTGGGTAESTKNREALKNAGTIIYLNSDPKHVSKWLEERKVQPNYEYSLEEDMKKRHELYSPVADIEIFTYPWNAEKFINEILCQILNSSSKNS